jgi:hypothetical protein
MKPKFILLRGTVYSKQIRGGVGLIVLDTYSPQAQDVINISKMVLNGSRNRLRHAKYFKDIVKNVSVVILKETS